MKQYMPQIYKTFLTEDILNTSVRNKRGGKNLTVWNIIHELAMSKKESMVFFGTRPELNEGIIGRQFFTTAIEYSTVGVSVAWGFTIRGYSIMLANGQTREGYTLGGVKLFLEGDLETLPPIQ